MKIINTNGNSIILFLGNDDEIIVNISFDKSEELKLKIPIKMYVNSAGYDLFANESITISKWSRASVNTNIRFDIPKGFYGEIKSRSGLALRNGILAFNGTIDAGYKGFVYVIIFNNSDCDFHLEKGNRIAQIIFRKCHSVSFNYCEEVSFDTERGVKGFGSSGV